MTFEIYQNKTKMSQKKTDIKCRKNVSEISRKKKDCNFCRPTNQFATKRCNAFWPHSTFSPENSTIFQLKTAKIHLSATPTPPTPLTPVLTINREQSYSCFQTSRKSVINSKSITKLRYFHGGVFTTQPSLS